MGSEDEKGCALKQQSLINSCGFMDLHSCTEEEGSALETDVLVATSVMAASFCPVDVVQAKWQFNSICAWVCWD